MPFLNIYIQYNIFINYLPIVKHNKCLGDILNTSSKYSKCDFKLYFKDLFPGYNDVFRGNRCHNKCEDCLEKTCGILDYEKAIYYYEKASD